MPDADTTEPATGAPADDTTTTTDPAEDAQLGEAGKKALDSERARATKAERELKALGKKLADLEAASLSDQERAVAEAKEAGKQEATAEGLTERVKDKIEAAASGKVTDPSDVPFLLQKDGDLSRFIDDGRIDTKAIGSAIDALVRAKPHLSPTGSRPAPLRGGGATPSDGASIDDWIRSQASPGR